MLQEFATLIDSGVSLATALDSIAHSGHHPRIIAAFADMAKAVRRGDSFATAFANSGLELPAYMQQLVEASELTGQLATALDDGVRQYEYDLRLRSEFRSALVYPLILVASGFAAIAVVFLWVVPRFGNLLSQRTEQLPDLSRWVIGSGVWLSEHLGALFMIFLALLSAAVALLRRADIRQSLLEILSRTPLVGPWLLEAEVGRWAGTLGTLLSNRVELTRALGLAEASIGLSFLRARLGQVTRAVRGGAPLSLALREHRALNPGGYDLVAVGEASGELPKLLLALARLYQSSGRERMQRVLKLIEPAAIILIGGAIGLLVTAVILAISSINDLPL
ncbi:MAG: type II secretion system protein [Silanimonas sp.]|nr:MAG: type II secretion system protein [Silanimonas sp.]